MARCFLKRSQGAGLNLSLAAAAWNLKKWLNELLFAFIFVLKQIEQQSSVCHQIKIDSPPRATWACLRHDYLIAAIWQATGICL
jgi:hypothetical protein